MKVLLFKGRGVIARLIRFQTRSRYHHAAIIPGSRMVEAFYGVGVRSVPFSARHLRGGSVDIFEVATSADQDAAIQLWLESQLGKKYDLTMVIRFFTRKQATRKTKGRWFCSELVYAAFAAAGIKLFDRVEPWEVSPGMLARSPLLVFKQTVKLK